MNLQGDFGNAKGRGRLLVQQALDNQRQYLLFAPTTPPGYASGNGIIPATGATRRATSDVPYKTPFVRKAMNRIKKAPI
jgi:hypothetical protein